MTQDFLEKLAVMDAIYVRQKRESIEIVLGFEMRNRYAILDDRQNPIASCAEQSKGLGGFLALQFLGHWREFELVAIDNLSRAVFRARHPFRFFFQRLEVLNAQNRHIGTLQQRFAIFSKKFDVLDSRGSVIMTVNSPLWKPWTFPFKKGNREVAVIEKKWSGLIQEMFTDADNFRVRFLEAKLLRAEDRLILLAAAIFVDLMFFETKA